MEREKKSFLINLSLFRLCAVIVFTRATDSSFSVIIIQQSSSLTQCLIMVNSFFVIVFINLELLFSLVCGVSFLQIELPLPLSLFSLILCIYSPCLVEHSKFSFVLIVNLYTIMLCRCRTRHCPRFWYQWLRSEKHVACKT